MARPRRRLPLNEITRTYQVFQGTNLLPSVFYIY